MMSLHGISRDAWNRYTASGSWYYEIEDAGYKYNMTDHRCGPRTCPARARGRAARGPPGDRARIRGRVLGSSTAADLLELPRDAVDGSHAWHIYIVRLHLDRLSIDRGAVIAALRAADIGSSVHFIPLHLHPYYRRRWGTSPERYPVATREYERVISLPIWPGMTSDDVQRVVSALSGILDRARRS